MNKRKKGAEYEQMAAKYLESLGMTILEYNYRIRTGEIDLIARDGEYLVFTEVKYRADQAKGDAVEAVGLKKQRTIIRTAQHYLMRYGFPEDTLCRFDVVGIDGNRIQYIKNAFWRTA